VFRRTANRLKGQGIATTRKKMPPSHGRGEERTCYPRNAPPVLGGEHVLQDSRHHGELHDAAHGGDHERRTDTEVKRLRDHRAERNKGEADADV